MLTTMHEGRPSRHIETRWQNVYSSQEDYYFFNRARTSGFPSICITATSTTHQAKSSAKSRMQKDFRFHKSDAEIPLFCGSNLMHSWGISKAKWVTQGHVRKKKCRHG